MQFDFYNHYVSQVFVEFLDQLHHSNYFIYFINDHHHDYYFVCCVYEMKRKNQCNIVVIIIEQLNYFSESLTLVVAQVGNGSLQAVWLR